MVGRILLFLCLGAIWQNQLFGDAVADVNVNTVATTPRPPICVLKFGMSSDTAEKLGIDAAHKNRPEKVGECKAVEKDVYCELSVKMEDCAPALITWSLISNLKNKNAASIDSLAKWYLKHKLCVWKLPFEMKNGKMEFSKDGSNRATSEDFDYSKHKDSDGCHIEAGKNLTVCNIPTVLSCDEKSISIHNISIMEAESSTCDQNCVFQLAEYLASTRGMCILKFHLDINTKALKFLCNAKGEDYKQYPELSNVTGCWVPKEKTFVFCRISTESKNCAKDFQNGLIPLSFIEDLTSNESVEPKLTKEDTTKMIESLLEKDVCFWRLQYTEEREPLTEHENEQIRKAQKELENAKKETDPGSEDYYYKQAQKELKRLQQPKKLLKVNFKGRGERVTKADFAYTQTIDGCTIDKINLNMICRIPYADRECDAQSITEFKLPSHQDYEQHVKKMETERNRFGPCVIETNIYPNCTFRRTSLRLFFPTVESPCAISNDKNTIYCRHVAPGLCTPSGVPYQGIERIAISIYRYNLIMDSDCLEKLADNIRKKQFKRSADDENRWNVVNESVIESPEVGRKLTPCLTEFEFEKENGACKLVHIRNRDFSDCLLAEGEIQCGVPSGEHCGPDHLLRNTEKLVPFLPKTNTCNERIFKNMLEYVSFEPYDDDEYSFQRNYAPLMRTTTTIDPEIALANFDGQDLVFRTTKKATTEAQTDPTTTEPNVVGLQNIRVCLCLLLLSVVDFI